MKNLLGITYEKKDNNELIESKLDVNNISSPDKENLYTFLTNLLSNSVIDIDLNNLKDNYPNLKIQIYKDRYNKYLDLIKNKNYNIANIQTIKKINLLDNNNFTYGISKMPSFKFPDYYYNILLESYPTILKKLGNNIDIPGLYIPLIYPLESFIECKDMLSNNTLHGLNNNKLKSVTDEIIQYSIETFKISYLNKIAFEYKTKNIIINSKNIIKSSLELFTKYALIFKNVLNNINSDNIILNTNINDLIKIIRNNFNNKIKEDNDLTLGFLINTLYSYDKKSSYNIPLKYLNKYYLSNDLGNELKIYLKNNSLKSIIDNGVYHNNGENSVLAIHVINNIPKIKLINFYQSGDKYRIILTNKNLSKINNIYNNNVIKLSNNLINNIEDFKSKKIKYLIIIKWLIDKNENNKLITITQLIQDKYNEYLKKLNNQHQTNPTIIRYSKTYFSKVVYDLNKELLTVIGSRNKLKYVIKSYNDYITKYSLWVIFILKSLGIYSNNTQEILYNSILNIFIEKKYIEKWLESCKKNKLYFYLPIKNKKNSLFFLNIITGNKITESNRNKINNFILVRDMSVDNTFYYWDTKKTEISNKPIDIINTIIKNYLYSINTINLSNKNYFTKNINRLCINANNEYDTSNILKNKMKLIESNKDLSSLQEKLSLINNQVEKNKLKNVPCKNFISLEQLIKEIIKYKYPLDISPLSVNGNNSAKIIKLDTQVRKYQNELIKIINKRNNPKLFM